MRRSFGILAGALCTLIMSVTATSATAQVDPELLAAMEARSIGPAGMSGRIGAIDALRVYNGMVRQALPAFRQKAEALGLSWATGLKPLAMIEYPYPPQ